jgi:large subunit ribosomal protein L25
MAAATKSVDLVKALPPRLTRFFRRFPPRITENTIEPSTTIAKIAADGTEKQVAEQNNRSILASHPISDPNFNPFLPWKNPATGRWRGAMYGLRKQADLCKIARNYGVEELLPWSRKKSGVKQARREILGVRVRGTGVGQKVKGHIWERQMISKMEKRRDAMMKMPDMIKEWKTVSLSKIWLAIEIILT